VPWKGGLHWFWQVCPCAEARWADRERDMARRDAERRQAEANALLGMSDGHRYTAFTLASFNPHLLRADAPHAHPYQIASSWLARALDYGRRADYRDPASPPAALFFYSAEKGRGKTHLAAALANAAQQGDKLVAIIDEQHYLERAWGVPFERKALVTALPAERAWLTVIDDLGRRVPRQGSESVANEWDNVINPRWLTRGWTIITSNLDLDDLAAQGTINQASYSRLMQMTRGAYVEFDGTDQRLVGVQ
jgi:hypothetical protein